MTAPLTAALLHTEACWGFVGVNQRFASLRTLVAGVMAQLSPARSPSGCAPASCVFCRTPG